jgi:acetyl-CoA carboxylase biotin carboxyl carrier protein
VTLTAKDVAEISRLLEESRFDELSLELDGLKLTLRRNDAARTAAAARSEEPVPAPSQPTIRQAAAMAEGTLCDVTAPLLGTFYRAPKPGAPAFVDVGSAVAEDTIIGIIEVMKLMNTVRAGTRGRVVDVLAQDGALVEFGATLMRISKATSV